MKKATVLVLLGIAVLGLTVAAIANTATRVRADVPFAFYFGKELMPAGAYIFEMRSFGSGSSASSVVVYSQSGTLSSISLSRPGDPPPANDAHLHFNRYGSRYFLTRVEGSGYQANLNMTPAEKEMRAQAASVGQTTIVAGN